MGAGNYKIYHTSKAAWQGMYEAISGAQKSIYWEIFILIDDEIGNKFFDLLEEKAKSGVVVKLIIDPIGSIWLSNRKIKQLKLSGIDIMFFSKNNFKFWRFFKYLYYRNHRKTLVIDEYYGFVGGVNVRKLMANWRDIHIRIQGNSVYYLLRAFAKSYIYSGGSKNEVLHLLKFKHKKTKNRDFNFVYDEVQKNKGRAAKKYVDALIKAKERVILFSPYYFPDKDFLRALWDARRRGVRIDLLLPFRADLKVATYVAHTWFSLMNKMGVNIHLSKKMMHGKGVIVDSDWAMIGSTNIDPMGFHNNHEANIYIENKKVVQKLRRVLEIWLKSSYNLKEINWEKRGTWHKIMEKVSAGAFNIFYFLI